MPTCSSLPEWHKVTLSSLQNQFLGCHRVTSHGSRQWRRLGGSTPLLAQLWAPGQAPSSWEPSVCRGERDGCASRPSLCTALSAGPESSPGLQRRDTRDQAHRIPRQGGRVAHTSHLPKKIKSKTPRHQLSITPPTPKERLRAGNSSVGIVFATQAGDPGYSPALRNKAGHSGTHPKPSAGR